jgi:glycine oxidase
VRSHDTVVIGGGAVGAACAWELASTGRRVLILKGRGEAGEAWRAAAGMLAPQIETGASDPLLRLGLAGRDYYPGLAVRLQETVGVNLGLWQEGIARVAKTESEGEQLRSQVAWQQEQGLNCEWLTPDDVRRRWPWLAPTEGALRASDDGALDPERLVEGLLAGAQMMGTVLTSDKALGVIGGRSRIRGVRGELGSYFAGEVVVAAGAWSGLLEDLPRALEVRPVRGQMAALPWPDDIPRAIIYHKDSYLLARRGEAVIGSTMEEAGFHSEVTTSGIAQVFSSTMSLCPGLLGSKVRRTWAGLRPMTPDRLPIIGSEPLLDGLWYATGHGRNGILLAGITAMLLRQSMNRIQPAYDLTPFSANRFDPG